MSKTAFEKNPLKSKKYLAWLISTLLMSGIIVTMIVVFELNIFACAIIITALLVMGFISSGLILGQASLDKFVRVAEITAGQVGKISSGTKEINSKVSEKIKKVTPSIVSSEDEEEDA